MSNPIRVDGNAGHRDREQAMSGSASGAKIARHFFAALAAISATVACSGAPASSEVPASFEQLTLEIFGGYGPEPCSNGKDSYEVRRASREFIWAGCDYLKNPAEPVGGARTLSTGELESLTSAYSKVTVSNDQRCGADAAVITVDVTTASGTVQHYADDFYSSCPFDAHAGRTFVKGLGELASVLHQFSSQ